MEHSNSNFTNEAVVRYFSDLQFRMDIYDKAKKEMDVYLANKFNVFDYINPNENKLSDIIADLLNPQGKHGQKDIFLKAFVNLLSNDFPYDLASCRVGRETSTAYIYNNQLQDYQKHLTKKCGEKFCLVYITGNGSSPNSINSGIKETMLADGRLVVFTYAKQMLEWLEVCYKECKAEKIRSFIKDFMQYIEGNFQDLYYDMEDKEDGE